jgi:hypothetical protein
MTVASIVAGKVAALRAGGNGEVRTVKPDITVAEIVLGAIPVARHTAAHMATSPERERIIRAAWNERGSKEWEPAMMGCCRSPRWAT